METVIAAVLELVRTHTGVMLPIVFGLAFGESLAFVTVVLVAIGGLIGAANVTFWPVWCAAAAGAAVGELGLLLVGLPLPNRDRTRLATVTPSCPADARPHLLRTMGNDRRVRWPVFRPASVHRAAGRGGL
jgi:hypothetical protein